MLLLNLNLLIDVTFSTPTGHNSLSFFRLPPASSGPRSRVPPRAFFLSALGRDSWWRKQFSPQPDETS